MIGSDDGRVLKTKAAETGTLLRFALYLAMRFQAKLGSHLVSAGVGLVDYLDITRNAGPLLTVTERQQLVDAYNKFLLNREQAGVYWKGKTYSRKKMQEGAKNLPWEAEAYKRA
jgi:hypothetical protein